MTIGEPVVEAGHDVPARRSGAHPQESDPRSPAPYALDELGERIATLAAQISAATYELLIMLRDFDERGGWNRGFRSCAGWLGWRLGLDAGAAREKVRVARALAALPRLSDAMRRGQVSYSKVRALTRIATPANEGDLVSFARAGTAAHVERLVRGMRRVDRLAADQDEQVRHAARYLRAYTDEDGMVVVTGRLSPEAGAALLRALDAGVEQLYGPCGPPASRPAELVTSPRARSRWNSAAPTLWAWWPRAPSPPASIPAAVATATRWWYTSTPRRCRRMSRRARAARRASTVRTFLRKRPAGWPATPRWW